MSYLSRRNFVRSAGLVTLFSPFLDLLKTPVAKAANGSTYENLLLFFTPGTAPASWKPRGSSDTSVTWSPMTEPLAAIKENVILVDNLSSFGTAAGHGSPGGLTGKGYGQPTHISVEQYISDKLPAAPIKQIVLGGVPTEQQTNFFRNGVALTPMSSLSAAHQALFGGFSPTQGGEPEPGPAPVDDKLRRRKSSLDLVKNELTQLSGLLGASERQKLELHAESIAQLEASLGSGSGGGGSGPIAGACAVPGQPAAISEYVLNSAAHLDLAIMAFACGRTHVAAVQFGHHQNTQVAIPEVGSPGDWHNTFMHSDTAPFNRLIKLEQWLCEQFVSAAQKLKAISMPDGETLFDKTLMLWARDMGDGPGHGGDDMRFVFAGGAGKYLKFSANGRYIDGRNAHHQSALIAACHAVGVTDIGGFGDTSQARMPLSGLTA